MKTSKKRCTAIVLSAGSGSRMQSSVAKQYMLLAGKPVIWYSLNAVEQSEIIDDCILVVPEGDISYVRTEIVGKYGFGKVKAVIAGGKERYHSVWNALQYADVGDATDRGHIGNDHGQGEAGPEHYIFIQDGARPFLTEKIIKSTYEVVQESKACVAAVPTKDTVKIADEHGFAVETPDRNRVWIIQTPQVFEAGLITEAYRRLAAELENGNAALPPITDDAQVVEMFTDCKVKMVTASYNNIKITTPDDLRNAELITPNAL